MTPLMGIWNILYAIRDVSSLSSPYLCVNFPPQSLLLSINSFISCGTFYDLHLEHYHLPFFFIALIWFIKSILFLLSRLCPILYRYFTFYFFFFLFALFHLRLWFRSFSSVLHFHSNPSNSLYHTHNCPHLSIPLFFISSFPIRHHAPQRILTLPSSLSLLLPPVFPTSCVCHPIPCLTQFLSGSAYLFT